MKRPNRVGDVDVLTLQFVPNVRAHGIVSLIDPGMVAHVVLDLVGDSVIAEIDQENLHRRLCEDVLRALGRPGQSIPDDIRRDVVIDPHPDPHGMDLSRVMQIDDHVADHLVVRDVEVDVVVCA